MTTAYFNGDWMPFEDVCLDPSDRGLVAGDSVFDAARTFNGAPFRLEEHTVRLFRSLRYARLDPGLSPQTMLDLTKEVVERNERLRSEIGDWQIWQFVTRGPGRSAADAGPPSVGIKVAPIDFGRFAPAFETGAHVIITRIRSVHPATLDPKFKCYSRMHFNLAELEASDVDPEGFPVLTDATGNITEGPGYNIFAVVGDEVLTPRAANVLEGISRSFVIELVERLPYTVREADLLPIDLVNADEVFLTATSPCVLPVSRVSNRTVGDGLPGEVTAALLSSWNEHVGLDIAAQAASYGCRS